MNREIYPKVKLIINQSMKEAKSFGDVEVKPEHVILSILVDDDNECTKIFKKLGVDTLDLYDKISDYLRRTDLTPRNINSNNRKSVPFSKETKAIIKSVDKECDKLNDNMIDITHIMLAILLYKLPINETLSGYNISYNQFKKIMKDTNNNPKNSLESDEINDENDQYKRKPKQGDTKTKTPVLDNFCRDISKSVEKGETDPVVGRANEIKRVSQILSRRKKNNPILIGNPGVGKCFCSDTEVVMRNDVTGETFKITITQLLKQFLTPN